MTPLQIAVLTVYYGALTLLVLFAAHRLHLVLAVRRARELLPPTAVCAPERVCVQLPIYNEPRVAERLLLAAAALEWPADRLDIQVLDDSSDETRGIVDAVSQTLRRRGVRIEVLRRPARTGFKAGALAFGLRSSDAPYVAIFDADFVPEPTFLRDIMPSFADDGVGLVQARWEHLNRRENLLTRAQALLLDGHFAVEQPARATLGAYFNFNGTAGVWRRQAIDDAGGWEADTLTEDLDLSYRAQLRGWRFVYRSDVVAPAEIPGDVAGFRSQQHRWAKGSVECLRKLGTQVLRAEVPARVRCEGLVHLTANLCYPLLVVVAVLLPVVALLRTSRPVEALLWVDVALFGVGSVALAAFYLTAASRVGRARGALRVLVAAISLDVGIAFHKAAGVVEALRGRRSPFVRTPKSGRTDGTEEPKRRLLTAPRGGSAELMIAAWNLWAAAQVLQEPRHAWSALPFLLLFAVALGAMGGATWLSSLRTRGRQRAV